MIALSELQIDVDSQSAELMEMIQILDLRDIATNIATGEVQLNAEAMINQSYGACEEGAEFAVSFHAFRGRELSQQDEIGSWESSLKCDIDPQTWESLISSVQVPGVRVTLQPNFPVAVKGRGTPQPGDLRYRRFGRWPHLLHRCFCLRSRSKHP